MATLTLVATPIGNLEDMTLRALETLRSADYVASEDTRKTGRLLKHFNLQKQQIAFHEHNEEKAGARIMELLEAGHDVALVSDAGTPGISDPGYSLVQRVLEAQADGADIAVTMAPGPAGVIMAAVLSGLPLHSFTFRGFPPRKSGRRRRFLELDAESPHTLIFYESPYRLLVLLEDAQSVYGDRPAAVARELTKVYEEVVRGSLSELHAHFSAHPPKGEIILVVAGATD